MTRLDGEKKSPLPWIIGLIVLALLAAGIYYFATANKGDQSAVTTNGAELQGSGSGEMEASNGADVNSVDGNMADANSVDANAATGNMTDTNTMDANSVDSNVMDSNSAMTNGADANAVAGNSADANSANAGNSETVTGVPVPAVTPASADANAKVGNDTMATRSKTIKTGDKTVIYEKSVKADGSLVRDKKIVPNPVEEAKKQ